MRLTSHSWLYAPILRRGYTVGLLPQKETSQIDQLQHTPTTQHPLELAQIPKVRFRVPMVSTLRPEKLVYSDFLVLSGKQKPSFHTKLSLRSPVETRTGTTAVDYESYTTNRSGFSRYVDLEDDGEMTAARRALYEVKCNKIQLIWPFPEHSKGFLYLHQPPPESGLPQSASSIRFRCTPSLVKASLSYLASLEYRKEEITRSSPPIHLPPSLTNSEIYEAFKVGYDLTLLNGVPWSIPIVSVAGRPSLENIRTMLLEDKLFSRSEMQEYEDIFKIKKFSRRGILLRTLDDAFLVRFGTKKLTVWATTAKDEVPEGKREKVSQATPEWRRPRFEASLSVFEHVFTDRRSKYGKKSPYTGSAYARFELVPGGKPRNPALSLRIVKIIEPVKCIIPDYDGFIHMPKEGELVMRGLLGKSKPWICQLDPSLKLQSSMLALVPGYAANANS